ncbi:MAG: ABC transporter ATP-binding protein [Lachnospiraceae bacterium]|nr:ABC transporter ATP-binding protein [Lachnospiraceae bacterium]
MQDGTFSEILDDWKWIFTYSVRYKWAIVFYVVLGIFSTTMGLVSAVVSKYLIDIVTGYQTDKLWLLAFLMVGSTAFSLITGSLISRISAKITARIYNDIQSDIFDKVIDADWLALSKYPNGDILNRFNGDITAVGNNAVSWLPTIIIAVYNFVATFIVLWHYDPVMALIAFVSAPFMLLASKFVVRKQREYGKKTREVVSRTMSFEVETFYNIDTIKSFGIMRQYSQKMKDRLKEYMEVSLDYNKFTIFTNIFMSILGMLVQMLAFFYCLYMLWHHRITYGTMTLFLQQRGALSGAFKNVVAIIPNFLSSSVSAHRIRELVELPREVHVPESSEMDKYIEQGFTVRMEDVNFSYVEGKQVITDSSFSAKPGEIVALVGPSGEGKTTMIRLILGLIRPEAGKVLVSAGENARVEANAESRHLFAYVPQGNTIISGTIADNLRMVKENATDEEVVEALKTACAWDFVSKMDGGINASVGERGRGLSEGQGQRVAIARAILRDAPILLLDEATSALDVTTERNVLRNIIKNHPNKTCIVTTHRPSVLNMCERVYRVMETQVTELDEETSAKMAMDF